VNKTDLDELELLLSTASAVVSMREVHAGARADDIIGLRHDVDDNNGSLDTAALIAQWERDRGYRSTYFILHTAPYWQEKDTLQAALEIILECGHEIGFHVNAITEGSRRHGIHSRSSRKRSANCER